MILGHEHCFEPDHIERHRGTAPFELAEQVVHCLELVSQLAFQGLDFCFKGGNAQLILLERPSRFSIDVDITTPESSDRVTACLDAAVKACPRFTRFVHRPHKTKPWIPLLSFQIHYPAHGAGDDEAFIMLDAMLLPSLYPQERKPVRCGTLYEASAVVHVPTIASLVGDKLLTLGPFTLGIPLGKGKEAQRIKHVFDVATLSRHRPRLAQIRESMRLCLDQEQALQKVAWTLDDVLQDTLRFCGSIVSFPDGPRESQDAAVNEIVTGMGPFAEHLFSRSYSWQDLQIDLARAGACMAAAAHPDVSDEAMQSVLAGHEVDPGRAVPSILAPLFAKIPEAARLWSWTLRWMGRDSLPT